MADEYAEILALARLSEVIGVDSFWVSEHHGAADSYLPSLMVMLAAVAAVTRRMRLGTAVVLAPFQEPLRFAEDCAVVDQLSRGRLIVGLGAGWRKREFEAFGIPIGERASRTAELARICRAAWDHERFSFSGRHFRFDDVSVTPKPVGHLPLLLGGSVPAAAARAGRLADGYMGTPANRIAPFRDQVRLFDEAASAAGKDPEKLAIGFHVNAWISADGSLPDAVRAAMWHQIGTYKTWHAQDDGVTSDELPPLDEEHLRERTIIGTPDSVVAQLRPWIEEFAGRDLHVILRLHYPGMALADAEPALRLLGSDVIPALKRIRPVAAVR